MRGYINEIDTDNYGDVMASWLGLCASNCSAVAPVDPTLGAAHANWVQQGMIQGANWAGTGESPTQVRFYYENWTPCNEYWAQSDAPAPTTRTFFQIRSEASGDLHLNHCANGTAYYAYSFPYKRGSASTPFFGGVMRTTDGRVDINTERTGANTVVGNTWFGCNGPNVCANETYAMEVLNNGTWNLCCGTPRAIGPSLAQEPGTSLLYRNTFNVAWSFLTCGVPSQCS